MTAPAFRVLLLEDSSADAELIEYELERGGMEAKTERVDSAEGFEVALREFAPHVILTDHSVASFDAQAALRLARQIRPAAPVILVSGALDARMIVSAMRAGAEDVVLKSDLSPLVPTIEAAVNARKGLAKLSPRQ